LLGLLSLTPAASSSSGSSPGPPSSPDVFRGGTGGDGGRRLFGGHVAAQAQRAAALTVRPEHRVSSLRAYFLRSGRFGPPLELAVERVRDGRSFTTRRVVARQDGETILTLESTFHAGEPGEEYEPKPPPVPLPDACAPLQRPPWMQRRPVDMRVVEPVAPERDGVSTGGGPAPGTAGAARRTIWMRLPAEVPDDPTLHACLLTYLTDMGPAGVVRASVAALREQIMSVSLDHCIWFHRPTRPDDWLLYDLTAVSTSAGRGLATGAVWTSAGSLAATVTQEVLLRPAPRPLGPPVPGPGPGDRI
jgi:acyl-CoA thioesterase-2